MCTVATAVHDSCINQQQLALVRPGLSWPAPAERPAAQSQPAQLRCAPADEGSQSSASDSLSTSFPPSTSASAPGSGWLAALFQLPGLLLVPLLPLAAPPPVLPPLAACAPLLPFAGAAAAAPLPQ